MERLPLAWNAAGGYFAYAGSLKYRYLAKALTLAVASELWSEDGLVIQLVLNKYKQAIKE